jgi:hypothetical protein
VEICVGEICRPAGNDWQAAIELRGRVREEILRHLGEPDLAGEYTSLLQMDIELPQPPAKQQ